MDFLYRLVCPDTPADQVLNKMQPDCLKLVTIIIQKCKYETPTSEANNVINKDAGTLITLLFLRENRRVRTNKQRSYAQRPQAKRPVVEKSIWPSANKISRMESLGDS